MRFWRLGLVLAITALVVGPIAAQGTADSISARLVDKVVFFRGLWEGNKLSFDAGGQPYKRHETLTFTESGLKVASVTMDGKNLQIKGERVAIGFDPDGVASVIATHEQTTITIDRSADFDKAVDAIFAPDLSSMVPSMPDYWQPYAKQYFLPTGIIARVDKPDNGSHFSAVPGESPIEEKPMHIGGSIRPPRVLHSSDPDFTETARKAKFSGVVQIYLWVDEKGMPGHLRLARPAGLGLDEAAIAAVQEYRFSPAIQNGKPVKVDLYIDVSFHIRK